MKRPQLISKGSMARLLQSADEARMRMDFAGCVEALEKATRMEPGNSTLLFNLGHAQGKNFEFAAAERSFERGLRLSPRKTEALTAAAMRAQDFGCTELAARYFRQ